MPRDRANIRTDMWADADWRSLSLGAQHLYMLLLSHPTLNYAGVADWREGRLAAMTAGREGADVASDASELEGSGFVLVDSDTEEVLVRSFIKHDGILKQPRLSVSMGNAYAAVASQKIREVVAFEVQKLHERDPDLPAWEAKAVQTILGAKASRIDCFTRPVPPGFTPGLTPNSDQPEAMPTTTSTKTATSPTENGAESKRGTRIHSSFSLTPQMKRWGKENAPLVDLDSKLPAFIDYWAGVPGEKGIKLDWVATWRNDMRKKQEFAQRDQAARGVTPKVDWMNRP